MYVCKEAGLEVFANQPGANLQWAERRKCLSKPGLHSRRQRRLENVLVISQGAMLWRARRKVQVQYHGWTDNSDVNKRLPLGTWIAHQAARENIKGRLQTPRKKAHSYSAEVFQPHLDGNWKKGKLTSGQASFSGQSWCSGQKSKHRRTLMGGVPAVSLKNKEKAWKWTH